MAKKEETPKTKIIIHVRGGCVTTVMSTDPNLDVELFDVDNMTEGSEPEEGEEKAEPVDIDALWEEKIKGMVEVW
jgi:hypothetical protein